MLGRDDAFPSRNNGNRSFDIFIVSEMLDN
jgi:hypothetical protein